jgi:hypothetical protein
MQVKLPFGSRLYCHECSGAQKKRGKKLQSDHMVSETAFPATADRPARKVAIDVLSLKVEDVGNGLARARISARVPCVGGDHAHEIDISDVYQAPQLHLEGNARCHKGHKMSFERMESWEFVDEAEYGGRIAICGLFSCPACGVSAEQQTVHLNGIDLSKAQDAGAISANLDAATPDRAGGG